MDTNKTRETLDRYNEETGNIYASVVKIARDAKEYQKENRYVPSVSEALAYILEQKEPLSLKYEEEYLDSVKKIIDDDLEGVLDELVIEYVHKSIYDSVAKRKLTFVYPYNDDGLSPKIRIHCKQIWAKLGL